VNVRKIEKSATLETVFLIFRMMLILLVF